MDRTDYFTCALKVEENRNKKMFCIEKVTRTYDGCFIDGQVGDIDLQVGETFTRFKNFGVCKVGRFYKKQELKLDILVSITIEKIFISFTSMVKEIPSHSFAGLQVLGKDTDELIEGMLLLSE